MGRNMNPPIRGHELISEGHSTRRYHRDGEVADGYDGGCRCGAKPPGWPLLSVRAVKAWHREHKAELRARQGG